MFECSNMPSYSVVEEIVLRRFAKLRPIDKAAMKAVNGVSKVFWKRFGYVCNLKGKMTIVWGTERSPECIVPA